MLAARSALALPGAGWAQPARSISSAVVRTTAPALVSLHLNFVERLTDKGLAALPPSVPVLIVHGREDGMVPLSHAEWYKDNIVHAEQWTLADGHGHYTPLLEPGFPERVRELLDGKDDGLADMTDLLDAAPAPAPSPALRAVPCYFSDPAYAVLAARQRITRRRAG